MTSGKRKTQLVVALDIQDAQAAFTLAEDLKKMPVILKIGWVLYPLIGHKGLIEIAEMFQGRIFLDFKLHDIPSVIAKGVGSLMMTVPFRILTMHASGGGEMLRQSAEIRDRTFKEGSKCLEKPILLGVTVLTSMNADVMSQVGSRFKTPEDAVIALAELSKKSGLDGVVSSVHEAPVLRKIHGDDFVILTPGIRPSGSPSEDQSRTATPSEARDAGSDYIVVGRPIIKSENPIGVVEQILHEIE